MADNFIFSILIAIHNTENYLNEAIDSIINQSFNFDNIQLILIDDGSIDNSKEIALNYQSKYPDNIIVLSKDNGGPASAYNLALSHIKGKYVNFMDSDDILSKNTLKTVSNFLSKNSGIDVVSIPIEYFEKVVEEHPLNIKFENKNTVVDLMENSSAIQLFTRSAFIRKEALKDYKFDERLVDGYDTLFINKILLDNPKYGLIGLKQNSVYYYRKNYFENSLSDTITNKKEFFTDKLKYFSKTLLYYSSSKEGNIPKFIKTVIVFDLNKLVNQPELYEDLSEDEKKEFWKDLDGVLSLLEVDDILYNPFIENDIKSFLIYLKNKDYSIVTYDDNAVLSSKGVVLDDLNSHRFWIDVIEIENDVLKIIGAVTNSFYKESINIEAIKESKGSKEVFEAEFLDYPYSARKDLSFLGYKWKFYHNFNFYIPIKKGEDSKIYFNVIFNNTTRAPLTKNPFKFTGITGLSPFSHYSVKDSTILLYTSNSFHLIPYKYTKMLRFELSGLKKIMLSGQMMNGPHAAFYRIMFLILFPFMKNRNIWLFNDRPNRADDNGKHLFSYAVKQDDDAEKYYVLYRNSKDFKKMKAIDKNIVPFRSFKHKILYLFSKKIISPFINEEYFNPFQYRNRTFTNGFVNSKRYFIQHGILVGNYSKPINKFRINISLFSTSSDLERQSILEGGYNYDEDVVQVLGLPRYDNLKNDNLIKQILFMPTWRNYLKEKDTLLKSNYFNKINSFLNNEKLIKIAKEKGYKIIFRPHPEMIKFADTFKINNNVSQISIDESYQDLFNNSSLMITDYSSVFFDFAYLKKPIIYYQYADEYHYDKGYFDFETMGFGDIISSEEELVDRIIEYIENDCDMEDKYKKRVDTFYKYTDKNNSKRVYEWILNH